jgi:hypothetical protein
MNASTITTPNADCDADEADNDLEAIEFDDALEALPQNVQVGYGICLTLDMAIGSDFSWWSLTGADIFERQTQSNLLRRRIDEGFSFGLSKQDIVGGITEALSIWSNAEDWAENLFAQLERDSAQAWDDDWDEESEEDSGEDSERGGLTDLETDCFVSQCADEDDELHRIRMREPLLYSAICVELSRAANC